MAASPEDTQIHLMSKIFKAYCDDLKKRKSHTILLGFINYINEHQTQSPFTIYREFTRLTQNKGKHQPYLSAALKHSFCIYLATLSEEKILALQSRLAVKDLSLEGILLYRQMIITRTTCQHNDNKESLEQIGASLHLVEKAVRNISAPPKNPAHGTFPLFSSSKKAAGQLSTPNTSTFNPPL